MQWLIDGITAAYDAFIDWFKLVFQSLMNFLLDFPVLIFEKILGFVSWLFTQFSDSLSCCFTNIIDTSQGLQNALNSVFELPDGFGSGFCYLFANIGLDHAFACVSAALMFRFTRKLLTLGRW